MRQDKTRTQDDGPGTWDMSHGTWDISHRSLRVAGGEDKAGPVLGRWVYVGGLGNGGIIINSLL